VKARPAQYRVRLAELDPPHCSPKNNVIAGSPDPLALGGHFTGRPLFLLPLCSV
jgi:hypothetical protein